MSFHRLCTMIAVFLGTLAAVGTASADPKGLWLAQDGAHVRVSSCGKALCGTIVKTKSPTDPDTGKPWTDKNNPDEALRKKPLVGVVVFIGMKPDGRGKWSGSLYSVENGRQYSGHLLEMNARTLRVEACVGSACGGQNMRRIRDR
jgi:uncharacterized protein (DUF2147 family)